MSMTRKSESNQMHFVRSLGRTALSKPLLMCVPIFLVLLSSLGCGYSQGQLLWAMGFGAHMKEPAEYELTQAGPVLVLVDDPEQRLESPSMRKTLALKIGRRLKEHEAVVEIIPQARLDRLRRHNKGFEDIACRMVGEKAEAEQVVWLEVRDLLATPNFDETVHAARMSVTVRVINANATRHIDVRLWPTEREGKLITTELHANEVVRAKRPGVIVGLLTEKMADDVVKLFYDHPMDES